MSTQLQTQPGFWGTVGVLLVTARKRAAGRRRRQQQLLNQRSRGNAMDWGSLGSVLFALFMLVINGFAAGCLFSAVKAAQRIEVEKQGKIVVSSSFIRAMVGSPETTEFSYEDPDQIYSSEAKRISERYGGSQAEIEQRLRQSVRDTGTANLISSDEASPGLSAIGRSSGLAAMVGSLVVFWWALMLAFQGEGMEMDVQRRRHPMWEWLFSHPAPPGAIFLAEMLAPIAANPMFWGGPLFAGIVYGVAYGNAGVGLIATPLIGVPVTVALACFGKALEIGILLRCSPRSRGAILGLMGWVGYTSLMLFLVGTFFVPQIITKAARFLLPFSHLPWPWLSLFLGARVGGSLSFAAGMIACWTASTLIIGGSVWFSVWSTQRGLSGQFSSTVARPAANGKQIRFGKEPLYRKEFLWFARDRSAIVQTLLVPLTIAGLQVFNLRGLLVHAGKEWNYLCGVAIFFGTYFLWVLGPKSLQSEGSALWIALTWPRGLESLLKAKAWLWSLISSGIVAIVLIYAAWSFPADIWKVALVGVGWFFFSQSMAQKAVTLVTVTKESGETEPVPKGRYWAAQLGMLTFAVGIVTAQWQLAIIGIVYSYITAAAMWQNLRARLPFLYDPWSEKLPTPPTLMHAMISISVLVELAALLSVPLMMLAGRENLGPVQAFSYGISAIVISLLVANFLSDRGVRPQDIWNWLPEGQHIEENEPWARRYRIGDRLAVGGLLMGASAGIALGLFGRGYQFLLLQLPATSEMLRKSQQQMASIPNLHLWYAIMAVGFAPFAEEFLFRGLLFRALDREWGGWRAVVGSAAFFAVYHPPLAWLPVGMLGVANALIFKKTGRLAPAVVLHMLYNAVVLT